jgi:Ca2+/Na+ antiporter
LSALADPRIGGTMRETRKQLKFALVIVLLVALALFVPSLLYFTELALRQLRMMWWLILVLAVAIWLLSRPCRKK